MGAEQEPAELRELAAPAAVASLGVSPAQLLSPSTLPRDTASQQHCDVELFSRRKWAWKQNLARGRTAAAPAEATLAKEPLIQVTGTITAPAEMLSQIFFTVCTTVICYSHKRALETAFLG